MGSVSWDQYLPKATGAQSPAPLNAAAPADIAVAAGQPGQPTGGVASYSALDLHSCFQDIPILSGVVAQKEGRAAREETNVHSRRKSLQKREAPKMSL